jgi:hypothetical protein
MRARIGVHARRNETRVMRNVHQKDGAHCIGNLPETREIDHSRIGARAGDDQLRFVFFGQPL